MSVTLIIFLLVALAVALLAVEAFLAPGIGVAGIGAAVCLIAADVVVYYEYGFVPAVVATLVSVAVSLLFLWWLSRSKAVDRMSLQSTISSTAATAAQLSVRPGDRGRALTRLALIGNAEIAGNVVEVKSAGAFIDEGTPVVVVSVSEALVVVQPDEG